jgi:hypothetical protein
MTHTFTGQTERRKTSSTGLPKGSGALQIRGNVYWMIYTDASGRKVQANAHTADFAVARQALGVTAIGVLRKRIAAIQAALDEAPAKAAGSRGNDPAAGNSRSSANRNKPARSARTGRTDSRKVGARSSRKGEAR